MRRYRVGCAGQFTIHDDSGGASPLHLTTDDRDEAIASVETGPVGCEVYDSVADEWIGPVCQQEIDEAKVRLAGKTAQKERFREWLRSYRGANVLAAALAGSAAAEDELVAAAFDERGAGR